MKNILILGSTSDVGLSCAHIYASKGANLTLASRATDVESEKTRADLKLRYGVEVQNVTFDALDTSSHEVFYSQVSDKIDTVISVFGVLGDHEEALANYEAAEKIILTNFLGNVSILGLAANQMDKSKEGTIICVSSVAGERGRMSNYIYGSSKAGLTAFLSGLRNRLTSSKVHVVSVQPGFIKTKMIEGIDTPAPLTATPDEVAKAIYKAHIKKKNTVYVKPIWRLIMLIIKMIPEPIFKKLSL